MDRQLFKETFSTLHASPDTITEVIEMANGNTRRKTRNAARTGALIALAAALLMGGALAATAYKLHTDPVGDLAMAVSVAAEGTQPGAIAFDGDGAEVSFTGLAMTPGWLPEGMELFPGETTKWSFEDNWGRGSFSLVSMPLNTGNATFCELNGDAESQENLTIHEHDAIYIKMAGDTGFNQRLYISYPEYNAVLMAYIGADVDYDTAMQFAENLEVAPGDYPPMSEENLIYNGKRYLDAARAIETGVYENTADEVTEEDTEAMEAEWWERNPANRAAKSGMADAHALGESFPVTFVDMGRGGNDPVDWFTDLTVTVTDVSVRDDVSALGDLSFLDPYVTELLDENGKLPKEDYNFYKFGNGINTPSSTLAATLPDQQLYMVAVTVEVRNDTDETVVWAGYNGMLLSVAETEDGWQVVTPRPEDPSVEYDDMAGGALAGLTEMRYWDLRDPNSNGGNEIADLAPGENVTIQMGFVVSECELGNLWFYMNDADIQDAPVEIHVGYVPIEE